MPRKKKKKSMLISWGFMSATAADHVFLHYPELSLCARAFSYGCGLFAKNVSYPAVNTALSLLRPGHDPSKEQAMIRVDLHTHTNHSHARDSVREMFEAGQAKGLVVHGFSEHSPRPLGYDYPVEYREHLAATFEEYLDEVRGLKAEQAGRGVTVLLGLEADWLEDELDYIRQMVSAHEYDYLIAGIHFLGRWGFDATADDWNVLSFEEKCGHYEHYYRTMKKMAETRLFHIVAHPDLVKIFSVDDFNRWLDLPGSMELIREALTAVRDAGMAMEISIAGTRKPCREIYPGPRILRLARELGLPISFASDSHATEHVAWNFDELARYAAAEGWTESVYFTREGMKSLPFLD